MPQLHPTRRTGRRLLTAGLLSAVVVLGTPAVASANPLADLQEQLEAGLGGITDTGGAGDTSTDPESSVPVGDGSTPDPTQSISAGAECVDGLISGIQVSVTGLADGLGEALAGLLGQSPITLPGTGTDTASGEIPVTPEDVEAALDPGTIEDAIADGQEQLTMVVEVVVGGVTKLVEVVIDFVKCLASLIPAATPTTVAPGYTPPAAAAPTTTVAPAVTTSAAPTQAVAYPGYAPTGGAPTEEDGSPAALVGLGLLTAATGGGALWLRARRGVA